MILQRIRIIVGDAGFEPRTSAPEVWCATNEPPHLSYYKFPFAINYCNISYCKHVQYQLCITCLLNFQKQISSCQFLVMQKSTMFWIFNNLTSILKHFFQPSILLKFVTLHNIQFCIYYVLYTIFFNMSDFLKHMPQKQYTEQYMIVKVTVFIYQLYLLHKERKEHLQIRNSSICYGKFWFIILWNFQLSLMQNQNQSFVSVTM